MWMKHLNTGGLAQVDDEAFAEVWADLGWESYDPSIEEVAAVNAITDEQYHEAAQPADTVVIINTVTDEWATVLDNEAVDETWGPLDWVRASFDEDGNPIVPPDGGMLLQAKSGTGPDVPKESEAPAETQPADTEEV